MSTVGPIAKRLWYKLRGTVVKSMGPAAGWVCSMGKTTGLGTAGDEASWLLC